MKSFTERRRALFSLLGICLLILLSCMAAGCGGGGSSGGGGGEVEPQKPDRNTDSYLNQVVNTSKFFRWTPEGNSGTIWIYIEVDDVTNVFSSERSQIHNDIMVAREAWKDAIKSGTNNSIESWTKYKSNGDYHSSGDCKLKVRYVKSLSGKAGYAQIHMKNSYQVDYVEVVLSKTNYHTGNAYTDEERKAITLHEFGHAFGIYQMGSGAGHSDKEADVMYPYSIWNWSTLSEGDKKTIAALYKMWPTYVRKDA